jgi:NRPS condensation-like uncharacterized protein
MTKEFAVDNVSILFLARICKTHTNTFRFSMTLIDPIQPKLLQDAVDKVWKRFPSVVAGFRPGFFNYTQFHAHQPPQVQPDPGLLITMPLEEIHRCAYRVFYQDCTVSIEAFHALTDGYGALTSFNTLVAEYLRLRYNVDIPVEGMLLDLQDSPSEAETVDDCLTHQAGKAKMLPKRNSYQLELDAQPQWSVSATAHTYPTAQILDAAHKYGVTATTLLTTVMADSVMEIQEKHGALKRPVRIMVPVDLRRIFGSRTLRNFSLYTLPALEIEDRKLPTEARMQKIHAQIREQMTKESMASMLAYNVRTQTHPLFRVIPRALKYAALRLGYRFFGEINSSVTVTNLGRFAIPEAMKSYVTGCEVIMTPRTNSPYGCSIISYGEELTVNISTFRRESELDEVFERNLRKVLA